MPGKLYFTLVSLLAPYLLNTDNALEFHIRFATINELSAKYSDSGLMSIIEEPRRDFFFFQSGV